MHPGCTGIVAAPRDSKTMWSCTPNYFRKTDILCRLAWNVVLIISVSIWSCSDSCTDDRVTKVSSVIDSDGVAGMLFSLDRFPQYLTRAIFGCANAVAWFTKSQELE